MHPMIGILCRSAGPSKKISRPINYLHSSYIQAFEDAGGIPLLIPMLTDFDRLSALLPRLGGLLLAGGIDIDPLSYDDEPHPQLGETDPQLDAIEFHLVRWALWHNLPTLGICRGMQVINVALGGTLIQHLDTDYPESLPHANWHLPRPTLVHTVQITPGSRMEQLLGTCSVSSNSLHHQAVREPGEGVIISGRAEDGIAELLEVPAHPFLLATQCHPEEIYRDIPAWSRLFSAFIEQSKIHTVQAEQHY